MNGAAEPTFPIVTATAADAADIAEHVNRAYRGETSRAGWTTEADLVDGSRTTADQLSAEIAMPNCRFEIMRDAEGQLLASVQLVRDARDEGRGFSVTGFAEGVTGRIPERPTCYLGMLTVRPTRQGAGIGKRFLAHAEGVAREWGCSRIRMTVIDRRSELLAYYERRGYVRTGVESPFHFDDPRFGVPRVSLQMVELAKAL